MTAETPTTAYRCPCGADDPAHSMTAECYATPKTTASTSWNVEAMNEFLDGRAKFDAANPELAEPANRRATIRKMLGQHGGRFHGPNVEHLVMEDEAFWQFIDGLIDAARGDRHL